MGNEHKEIMSQEKGLPKRWMRAFMRLFYKLLYHRMAWTYDWVAAFVSVGMWQEWVRSVIPYIKGPRVLELGHGPGHLQESLLQGSSEAFFTAGVDFSPQMGRMALRRLQRKGLPSSLVNGDARKLPFRNESFSSVVATFPSEYMYDPQTREEIRRILQPGGELILLPLAYITGKRLRDRGAAFLFRVTGQAPDLDESAFLPAQQGGFEISLKWIELAHSRLLLLTARKTAA
jgi:ubiquinone/menaquinone biosynthesis C-methylase UbiE